MAKSTELLESFFIESDLAKQEQGAIEIILTFKDGRRRWCYFITPQALTACGDWIDGTQLRIHHNAPYMIVVAAPLTESVIEAALRHVDKEGKLEACSMSLENFDIDAHTKTIRSLFAGRTFDDSSELLREDRDR